MERAYRAALACLPGMSALALPRLLRLAGGARELWEIVCGGGGRAEALVGKEKAALWAERGSRTDPQSLLFSLEEKGVRVILPGERGLPAVLWSIYDPPALIFARGGEPPEGRPWVAVVGSRKASGYGRRCAEYLGRELAIRGVVVVSGAAHGIDRYAHEGCLAGEGFTAAVLGCGIDRVYPSDHALLYQRIARSGCLLSEYPPGEDPLPWRFPHRNRLIAGLAQAVVVVEASEKSGALITAEFALEEGREVMAVPGPIDSPLSRGTHGLIQKGAKLVASVEDVLEEICHQYLPHWRRTFEAQGERNVTGPRAPVAGFYEGSRPLDGDDREEKGMEHGLGIEHGLAERLREAATGAHPSRVAGGEEGAGLAFDPGGISLDAEEELVLVELMRDGEKSLDWLAARSGKSAGELLVTLTRMQLKGMVREEAGGRYGLATIISTIINNNKI